VAIIEVEFSVGPLKAAIDRGARFGMVLLVGALLAFVAILYVLLERELVAPLGRVARAAARAAGVESAGEDALGSLKLSVAGLIEQEAEAQRLAQAQRQQLAAQAGLAQVGEMAAEMAHEFKRPLASVRTAMELLGDHVTDERGRELLVMVDAQLERLTETMHDLFALARPETLALGEIDVRDLLDDALLQLAGHPSANRVQLTRDLAPDALTVWGDRRRLGQAMANVVVNALDAMPDGGTLTVRSRQMDGGVEVSVEDTGPGIPPEEVERVLRPFYSTKELGTGLGLPLVARIIGAHGGRLTIEGARGQGTAVRLLLPGPTLTEEASWQRHESSSLTTTT
jgi:signal transduction histidine kinase